MAGFSGSTLGAVKSNVKKGKITIQGGGIDCGFVTSASGFPTTRPDGTALQKNDYVRPSASATFPLIIGSITIPNKSCKVHYTGSDWALDTNSIPDTSDIYAIDQAQESIEGDKETQQEINKSVVDNFRNFVKEADDLDTITDPNLRGRRIWYQKTNTSARNIGYYTYNNNNHRWEMFGKENIKEIEDFTDAQNPLLLYHLLVEAEYDGITYAPDYYIYDELNDKYIAYLKGDYNFLSNKPFVRFNGYLTQIVNGAEVAIPSTPKDKGMQIVNDIETITSPDPEIIYKQMVDTIKHPIGQYTWDGEWHRQPLDIIPCKLNYIKDYLGSAEYTYDKIMDEEKAFLYFQQIFTVHPEYFSRRRVGGGCTAVRKNNLVGRNFDWTYDEKATFVVKTNHTGNKNKVIGVCGNLKIDNETLKSLKYSDFYELLPYTITDGVNEHHLFAEINVVPSDKGTTYQNDPSKHASIYTNMIVGYILTHHSEAGMAVRDIANNFNVRGVPNEEVHFLIADLTSTYILEFVNNETRFIELRNDTTQNLHGKEWQTNFHLTDGANTKVEEHIESLDWSTIEPHGQGLERWQYILENISTVYDLDTMLTLMCNLNFSKAYQFTDPLEWKSEFVNGDLTIDSPDEDFEPIIMAEREKFANRSRDSRSEYFGTWHTSHTSIYDIENLTLNLICQEENKTNVRTYSMNEDSVFDDSDSAKYSTNKGSSNLHLQEQFNEIKEEIRGISGTVLKGNCTLTDVSSESAIKAQLSQFIRDTWSEEPKNNYLLYTTYNGARYIDYVYVVSEGVGDWLVSSDKRNYDLTPQLLANTYNATHLDFSDAQSIQKLKCVEGDTYILQMECDLNTPILDIGRKDKIGELPIQIGGLMTIPMMILRGSARKKTELIATWFEPGGEHYIDVDTLYANAEFYFDDVTIDDEEEEIGTQEVNAYGPVFNLNGMPKMIKTQKKLTIADTEDATDKIYVYQVLRDNEGNPVPKMHGTTPVLDKNGNQAWVLRKFQVFVDKNYLYGKELHLQGCPIDSSGNLGYHDASDDPDYYCDYYDRPGHFVGTHATNGIYQFRPSYAFSEIVLCTGFIEDNPAPATTSNILKPAGETCAAFAISYLI